jgi:hypothetical protein
MTYPEPLPDSASEGEAGHIDDHNQIVAAVGSIDGRLNTAEGDVITLGVLLANKANSGHTHPGVYDPAGSAEAAKARSTHTGTQLASTISDLPETVQDTVGTMVVAGANMTATYNDGAGTLTLASTGAGSGTPVATFDKLKDYLTNGYSAPPVQMSSPPTIAVSASGATSALSGTLLTYQPNNAVFTYTGAAYTNVGTLGSYTNSYRQNPATESTNGTKQNRLRVEFETDAVDFEVILRSESVGARFRVWVDGQPAHAHTALTATATEYRRVRVTFASSKVRHILIEAMEVSFCGAVAVQTRSIWKSLRDTGPVCVAIGDSYGYGIDITANNPMWIWDAYTVRAGRYFGWDVHPAHIGYTGFVGGPANGQPTYGTRLTSDCINLNPDIVLVCGTQNDGENNILSAAQSVFNSLDSALPNAQLIGFSGVASIWDLYTGIQLSGASIQTAVTAVGGQFISGLDWCGGNGNAYAPNGTGNADFYSDGVWHMTVPGYTYVADRLAGALSSLLTRRA